MDVLTIEVSATSMSVTTTVISFVMPKVKVISGNVGSDVVVDGNVVTS